MKPIYDKNLFYVLSFTWGLPLTVVGYLAALGCLILGKKPERFGWCLKFTLGNGWGGINFGPVIVVSKSLSQKNCKHEHGHAFQNCYFGFLMPFIVCIPSVARYWYFRIAKPAKDYDSAWFERDATALGIDFFENLKNS